METILQDAIKAQAVIVEKDVDIWDRDGRCKYCGAGDNYHHSWSCPTDLHVDKVAASEGL
jgi:hypothetical protein